MESGGYMEESMLRRRLQEGASREEKIQIKKSLVSLYIRQAEYFKLSDQPDFKTAKKILEKAIRLAPQNPLAHYRLGYIHYRDEAYATASHHFNIALDGTTTESLSEVQMTLAHMFLVNCGIHIARESLREVEGLEDMLDSGDEKEKIHRYRAELLVQEEQAFDRLYYRKIQSGEEKIINETAFQDYAPSQGEMVLKSSEEGKYVLSHLSKPIELNMNHFYLLVLLSTRTRSTYQSLQTQLTELIGEEVSYDNLRQSLPRLKKKLPAFDTIFNTIPMTDQEGSRINAFELSDEWTVTILCRADDFLKNEV